MKTGGQDDRVICLADGGYRDVSQPDSKLRVLGGVELLIVINFILITAIDPTLLHSLLVMDRAHESALPLNDGLPVLKSCIQEK